MEHVIIDALIDSLHLLLIIYIVYIVISFIEKKIKKFFQKSNFSNPLVSAALGVIPECGISVIASDLYIQRHITIGSLFAVFIACSDEAILILFARSEGLKVILPLILIKFALGFIFGYLIDFLYAKKETKEVDESETTTIKKICLCHHSADSKSFFDNHFYHPLLHAIKIFIFVFLFNLVFNSIIYFIGEENIAYFLQSSKYFAPLLSPLIGVIPNCSSSIIITELFLSNSLSFGAMTAGLIMNSGLGILILFKQKKLIKEAIFIVGVMYLIAVSAGYIICLIHGF